MSKAIERSSLEGIQAQLDKSIYYGEISANPDSVVRLKDSIKQFQEVILKVNLPGGPHDVYGRLSGLSHDLDLYFFSDHPSNSFISSTGSGRKEEFCFTQIDSKKDDLFVRISSNQPLKTTKDLTFKFDLDVYTTGLNPYLATPNDPFYAEQWYLFNGAGKNVDSELAFLNFDIAAPEAWTKHRGSRSTPIAVIDSGIDLEHPDLNDNIWVNKGEIPGNNLDDDSNGFVDDVHGWDFITNQPDGRYRKSMQENIRSHGTHVAGIIGAEGNNKIGITGINWESQLMSLNVFDDGGLAADRHIINAINYAINNGAKVINLSLGEESKIGIGQVNSKKLESRYFKVKNMYRNIFRKARNNDVLIVMAAGNAGSPGSETRRWNGVGDLNSHAIFPYSFAEKKDNLILVTSVDSDAKIAPYANYGNKVVDIAAPGGNVQKASFKTDPKTGQIVDVFVKNYGIYSTVPDQTIGSDQKKRGAYMMKNGTSMAAPVITGAAALIWDYHPKLEASDVKKILINNSIELNSLEPFVIDSRALRLEDVMNKVDKIKSKDDALISSIEPNSEHQAVVNCKKDSCEYVSGLQSTILKGSPGKDLFIFNNMATFSPQNMDKIINFNPSQSDQLLLPSKRFKGLSNDRLTLQTVASTEAIIEAAKQPVDIIYFKKSGQLFFNANRDKPRFGGEQIGGLFAEIKNTPDLTPNDFAIVDDPSAIL